MRLLEEKTKNLLEDLLGSEKQEVYRGKHLSVFAQNYGIFANDADSIDCVEAE